MCGKLCESKWQDAKSHLADRFRNMRTDIGVVHKGGGGRERASPPAIPLGRIPLVSQKNRKNPPFYSNNDVSICRFCLVWRFARFR